MLCSHLELGLTKITSLKIYVAKFRWQPSETFSSLSPSSFYFSYMYVLNFKQYTLITVSLIFLNSDYSSSCDFKNLWTIWIILFQWLFVLQNTSYISIFNFTVNPDSFHCGGFFNIWMRINENPLYLRFLITITVNNMRSKWFHDLLLLYQSCKIRRG